MSDKLQDTLNKDGISAALLTGLSKPFDCLPHVLLIAKLRAYGIELSFLRLLYSHFVQQKQEQESYSTCLEILLRFHKDILGPLLFNILLCDLVVFISNSGIASYEDDNMLYHTTQNINEVIDDLVKTSERILAWFKNN